MSRLFNRIYFNLQFLRDDGWVTLVCSPACRLQSVIALQPFCFPHCDAKKIIEEFNYQFCEFIRDILILSLTSANTNVN
jgi:hypothetical protein